MAYQLWAAVEDERLKRGWTAVRMAEHLGLPRNTISRLKTSPRPPHVGTVHTIADSLGIDREEAEEMAGLRPPTSARTGAVSVREAIQRDWFYTEEQRRAMLAIVDAFDRDNGGRQD
ncbi:XRE family transcriptional regulator [Micromonospora fluostatini]|uniref:XRE family transcriptional regulator n=1 Tax=Micromonospora fluostatini TaxID=1629071 RepID=A0ABY2DC41_9ACTN|nr:XRE family transcriptional regulator [Micromonospora fluostatini]